MKKLVGTISIPKDEIERALTSELVERNQELREENTRLRQHVKDLEQALREAQSETV
jgi:cell division protein FtsB